MNILVTGGNGFVGSHLIKRLLQEGHEITATVRQESNLQRIAKVISQIRLQYLDEDCHSFFKDNFFFEIVIHCATNYGLQGTPFSRVLEDNVIFPTKLLEASIEKKVILFINTDTFFSKRNVSYEYLGNYIYSKDIFKRVLEKLASRIAVANCRLEHVYGTLDSPDKFVPSMIHKFLANESSIDLTEGTQRRDFIFVDDVIEAYIKIISNYKKISGFEEYEVGTGTSISIREFLLLTKKICAANTELNWGALQSRINEFERSEADTIKLRTLGWQPQTQISEGLLKIITEIKNHGI